MNIAMHVPYPQRWWTAVRADFPDLVEPAAPARSTQPGEQAPDWSGIARTVQQVGRALSAGEYGGCPSQEEDGQWAVLVADVRDLSEGDVRLVRSWFSPADTAVRADAWDGLDDRHERVRHAWQAAPDALLPFYSDLLADLDHYTDYDLVHDGFGRHITYQAARGLAATSPRVTERNLAYVQELRRVAAVGQHLDAS